MSIYISMYSLNMFSFHFLDLSELKEELHLNGLLFSLLALHCYILLNLITQQMFHKRLIAVCGLLDSHIQLVLNILLGYHLVVCTEWLVWSDLFQLEVSPF